MFAPPQAHLGYYRMCFEQADTSKTGKIGGGEAVTFMMRSGLTPKILKEVRRQGASAKPPF